MSYIAGVRIQPGFFNQKKRKVDEYRVGASPVRLKKTSVPKPRAPKGKYAMPVVAVVAAIGSFAAGAAIATAATATVGAMVVGGMMMAGAAMTIVGTVTGNKNLTKWGGIVSLVGGVGALGLGAAGMLTEAASTVAESTAGVAADGALVVDGAGLASETGNAAANAVNDVAGGAAGGAAAVETTALPAAQPVTQAPLDANAPLSTSGGGMVSQGGAALPIDGMGVPATDATAVPAQTPMGADVVSNTPAAPAAPSDVGTTPAANTSSGVNTSAGVNTGTDGLTNSDAAAGINGGKVTPQNDPSLFSRYEAWAAKNPNLNKTAGYIANSVGGMLSSRSPTAMQEAQINLYAEQAKLTDAQRQQLLTRMKNMSGVSSWKK